MVMEKGDREGQWHARFPRNDRLCCNYEPHVLLANMGNIDWRPVLNLWAVVQYVTKYATKAPKGSRKLQEVLKDAVDEVCTYVPEGEGSDFLRRSIQKFFARSLGERGRRRHRARMPPVLPHVVLAEGESYTASVRRLNEFNYHGLDRKKHPGGHLAAFHPAPRDSNGYGVRVGTTLCVPGLPAPRNLDELEARLRDTMPHTRLVRVHDAAQRADLTPRLRCALDFSLQCVRAASRCRP